VAHDDLQHRRGAHHAREDARLHGDPDVLVRDGLRDGGPGGHGRRREGARVVVVRVDDARVGRREEHEHARCEPDGDEGPDGLGLPLLDRWRAQEEAGAEVARERICDVRRAGGDAAGDQIQTLRLLQVVHSGGGAAEDELRGLGCSGERRGVGDGADLDAEEGEQEAQEGCQDRETDVHPPLDMADDEGDNEGDNQAEHPHPVLNEVLRTRGVFDELLMALARAVLGEEGDGLAALLGGIVEGGVDFAEDGLQCHPDYFVLDKELSEGCTDHDHDTWPEKPVTGGGGVAISKAAERGERHVVVPDGIFRVVGLANAFAVVN